MGEFSFLLDSETVIDRIKDDLIAEREFSDDEVETLEKWLESGDTQTRQHAANALQIACEDDEFLDAIEGTIYRAIRLIIKGLEEN